MLHTDRIPAGRQRTSAVAAWAAAVICVLLLGSCGVDVGDDVDTAADRASTADDSSGSPFEPADRSGADEPDGADDRGGAGDAPSGSDAEIRDTLIDALRSGGLSTEQATCLADGYIDLGITDPDAASAELDIMGMMDMLSQCGISIDDLGGLGAGLGS